MSGMFANADAFNQDIGGWNVGKVTDMSSMFSDAISFNQGISGWNVSNVEDMSRMFFRAVAFDQDLSKWQITAIKYVEERVYDEILGAYVIIDSSMNSMFHKVTLSTSNYDALLMSWSTQNINSGIKFDAGESQYSVASAASRQRLIEMFNWTVIDGGQQ
jgi:surface protein